MILIAPFARKMRNGMPHAKDFPFWSELLKMIDEHVVQVGTTGEKRLTKDFRKDLPLPELEKLILECKNWVSVDSFLPHMAKHLGKPGIVLWSVSDPEIFGYPENLNLLKDRKYLRKDQFAVWEAVTLDPETFVGPEEVYRALYPEK
jgi:ADP-heptose:LPS heptosyltransferase